MQKFLQILFCVLLLCFKQASSQSVIDPNDPIVRYTSGTLPAQPADGTIGKWISTDRSGNMPYGWKSTPLKAYIYRGMAFRVQFPKSYNPTANDGKKYPVFVFFHGRGESGPISDNEWQLYHGGYIFSNAVLNGQFDGYLLYPQNTGGFWTDFELSRVKEILDYMAANNKVDLFRVIDNGLSSGGAGTWDFKTSYPSYVATCLPMSNSGISLKTPATIDKYKFSPVWLFQGALDGSPAPYTSTDVVNTALAAGANIRYTIYDGVAHDTWYHAWAETDFLPTMNRAHILTPWPLFGRSEFCTGDPINLTVGISPGFSAYKWQKDGQDIPNSNSNSINVTALGSYAVSVSRDNGVTWSVFSPTPLVVKIKAPTQTPPITTGMKSNVIPAPDGSTSVTMRLPAGYTVYNWFNSSNQLVSTDSTYTTSVVGTYTAKVTEQYGCSSNASAPFSIINANGPNGPDGIQSLTATPVSKTALRLDWTDKVNPQYNETLFEVYRSLTAGGPYTLVAKVPQDVVTYTDNGLIPNTNYYYVIRPINNNAAGPVSAEVRGATIADTNPPTPPANLRLNGPSTSNSIPIAWDASTDDVGVASYEVYVNGVKTYTVDASQTNVVLYGLTSQQYYSIYVVAKDLSGNYSVPSSQLAINAIGRGWKWTYYETPSGTTWSNLPNFSNLTALASGYSMTIDISVRQQDVNYAMMWTGYLRIPTTGSYQFQTYSDDGSKLFVNKAYTNTGSATVNNDGAHAAQYASSAGTMSLTAGQVVPITAVYFQAGGDQVMQVKWKIPGSSNFVDIDPSYLQESATNSGATPNSPSAITAVANSYKSVTVSWTDNDTNEDAFEIYRASAQKGAFSIIGRVSSNTTSFTDMQVQPNTRYYYRVIGVNKYGSSAQINSYPYTAIWKLNGNTADSSYAGNNATAGSAVTYTTDAKEGTQAAVLNGSANAFITLSNGTSGSFLQDAYSKRTISMWIKPTNVTVANQYIFEQGSRGNGLAIRLNKNVLEAAYGGNGNSTPIKATVTPTLSSNTWYHVAVVFDTNGRLKIYLNGYLYQSSTNTSTAISNSTETAYIGKASGTNSSNNAFNDGSPAAFYGIVDNVIIIDSSITDIASLQANTLPLNLVTTGSLPSAPADPGTLTAAVQGKAINLTWKDNANNENQYEIQRSVGSSTDYRNFATINAIPGTGAQASYTDSSVFANETYNYRVRAVNDGGQSNYSNVASATAPNNPPKVAPIPSRTIRYDNPIQIPLVATDPDGDPITFTFMNLPTFITQVNGPNGPYLNVATDSTKQGAYLNIVVIANDNHGASDTTNFSIVINNNYPPVLNAITNVSMLEGETQQINLTATDQDTNNTYTWTGVNMPSFITLNGNGLNCTATINPSYVDAGTYPVSIRVTDNQGGTDVKTFTLTVSKGHPNGRVLVNFNRRTVTSWDGWNILQTASATNLRNQQGDTTRIGIQMKNLGMLWNPAPPNVPSGATTAYPTNVISEYTYFGALTYNQPDSIPVIISGLDVSKLYYLKFFSGGSSWMDNLNGATTYRVGDSTKTLYTLNNYSNTANFYNLKPNPDGTILAAGMRKDPSYVGEFSVIELGWNFDDGLAPATPKNLVGSIENQKAKLTWIDVAYNETSYQIFRSQDSINNYTLLASTPPDATSYVDATALGNQTYYYQVRAFNSAGGSMFSNYVGITLPNKDPILDSIPDVKVRAGNGQSITLHATDDAADQPGLQLLAIGLPSFAVFTDGGNGNGQIVFSPSTDNVGTYNITIQVKDIHGGIGTRNFRLFVSDKNTTLTYFNLGASQTASAPWNTVVGPPLVGAGAKSNVLDENNTPNGMSFYLLEGFTDGWYTDNGMNTGQNAGIYPDSIMMTSWYLKSGTTRKMVVHGLDPNKRYNFVFFASQNYGFDATTTYTIGTQTVTLNGAYNIGKTVQINGITPSGDSALITFTRPSTQDPKSWAYIGTLVVESYDPTVAVVSPGSLRATVLDNKRISLVWADRSNNETGFQIWRKTGITGTESLLATTVANTTAYLDSTLTANTPYIYRVRAVKSGVYSDYSASAGGTTFALNVYVNFCDTSYAPAPWNNTSRRPAPGVLISNLKDDSGVPTNIGMTIMDNFAGIYGGQGMTTGNNSGVYPDAVMKENFVLFAGAHASMKITGLNQSLAYNLTVFSSALDLMDYNTKFTANGKQVTWLNAYYNTKGTATIFNVVPDQNGEIRLDVDAGPNSSYGLLGAMVIQGFTPSSPGAVPGSLQTLNQNVKVATDQPAMSTANNNTSTVFADVTAFPNPFVNQLNIDMTMNRNSSVILEVFNLNGQRVYGEMLSQIPKGRSTLRINTGASITIPGYYLIRLTDDQHKTKVIRAIKQ